VGKPAGAPDPGNGHDVLRVHLLVTEEPLDDGQHAVIATALAPPRDFRLVILQFVGMNPAMILDEFIYS
jgi:hypothetical protein